MATAVILLRFVQYGGAAILFGVPFFFLYSSTLHDAPLETKPILLSAAAALALAAPLGFLVQLVQLAGSLPAAMDPSAFHIALLDMNFGKSSLVRIILAFLALVGTALSSPGRRLFRLCAGLGLLICGSFAWMGHGAASEGALGLLHLAADIIHVLAAAAWIGALVVFGLAVKYRVPNLHAALAGFSGTGSLLVALLIMTGLINNTFLVGWDLAKALSMPYGKVLAVKLVLFMPMLLLAAMNRYRLTPALGHKSGEASVFAKLRCSIMLETAAGFGVLAAYPNWRIFRRCFRRMSLCKKPKSIKTAIMAPENAARGGQSLALDPQYPNLLEPGFETGLIWLETVSIRIQIVPRVRF